MRKPPKRCTDPAFRYTPALETNIRKTFARVRRELAAAQSPGCDSQPKPERRDGQAS